MQNSIIYTHCWKGYSEVGVLGYQHKTVNHSKRFVDPILRVHTNTI